MTLNDDPKLTAFALGELEPDERAALEAELGPEALAEIEEIQKLGSLLEGELQGEPQPALTAEQRAAVEAAAAPAPAAGGASAAPAQGGQVIPFRPWYQRPVLLASAASLMLAGGLTLFVATGGGMSSGASRQVAEMVGYEAPADMAAGAEEPFAGPAPAASPAPVAPTDPARPAPSFGAGADLDELGDDAAPVAEADAYALDLSRDGWEGGKARRDAQRQQAGPEATPLGGDTTLSGIPAEEAAPARPPADSFRPRAGRGEEQSGGMTQIDPPAQRPAPEPKRDLGRVERDLERESERRVGAEGAAGERYRGVTDNPFASVRDEPLSTFSIDVDTASYSNTRRFLMQQYRRPPADAVRIEELINYFGYDYAPPTDGRPFAVHVETAACPWREGHRLVRVGLKGREVAERPTSNLVFLIDVSGSMRAYNRLPLLQEGLKMLVEQLDARDRVSVVVYAGASGVVLPPTPGDRRAEIMGALDRLRAGGSTNGGAGIQLAYRIASENYVEGGVNRVILATDGDFNVGTTGHAELVSLIEKQAQSGVFLSVLGFGMGNLNDGTMEQLADKGNGNYAYIDTQREARKVLVQDVTGTLITIAKDVKLQVEFNPAVVSSYRLIGYENRVLAAQDFNDDTKDAGEIGAGHTVTALYEVVPTAQAQAGVDPLKYQETPAELTEAARSGELLTVKLRWKEPEADVSTKIEVPVRDGGAPFQSASADTRFAAAVAAFGMLLRDSPHKGTANLSQVLEIAETSLGPDRFGYRAEFLELVRQAQRVR